MGLPFSISLLSPTDLGSCNKYIYKSGRVRRMYEKLEKIRQESDQFNPIFTKDLNRIRTLTNGDIVNAYEELKTYEVENLKELGKKYELKIHKKKKLPISQLMAYQQHKKDTRLKLNYKLHEAEHNNWYPIFSTLTIKDINALDKTYKDGWRQYKRKVENWAGKENIEYYYAVPEKGTKNQRDHLHVLWILKDIPDEAKRCPNNRKIFNEGKQEITGMKRLWNYGISQNLAVRYGEGDVWARIHKWTLPTNPGRKFSTDCFVTYLTKELTKQIGGNKRCKTRIRTKQNCLENLEKKLLRVSEKLQKKYDIHLIKTIMNQILKTPGSSTVLKKMILKATKTNKKYEHIMNAEDLARNLKDLQKADRKKSLKVSRREPELRLKKKLKTPKTKLNHLKSNPEYNLKDVYKYTEETKAALEENKAIIRQEIINDTMKEIHECFEDWEIRNILN